jgi:hypothetical protein
VKRVERKRRASIIKKAVGTFDVKIKPLPPYNSSEEAKLARMSIDKQFHGNLEASSKGEMLSAGTDTKGSAGYVAIERVSGALNGLSGTMQIIIDKGNHSYEFQYSLPGGA